MKLTSYSSLCILHIRPISRFFQQNRIQYCIRWWNILL